MAVAVVNWPKAHKVGVSAFCSVALASSALAVSSAGSNFPYDAPPDGEPGECFARVLVPAQYQTYSEQVAIDDGGSRISVSAPQFAAKKHKYILRDASVRYEVRQPVYKRVNEKVMVRPGYQTLQVIPGEYRTVNEQVQVSPPRLSWKPGASLASRAGVKLTQTRQGEVYCLVEEPAETQTISKRVQVRQERVQAINVPPVYRMITREVLVDPGGVREVHIPAQYGYYEAQYVTQPARQVRHPVAPRMANVTRKKQVSGEKFRWIKVLCETNATPAAISEVQGLLHKQGLYQGPVDGQTSPDMEAAIASYQQQMNIPHGGFLSLQTIEHLRNGAGPLPVPFASGHAKASHQIATAPMQYSYESQENNRVSSYDSQVWQGTGQYQSHEQEVVRHDLHAQWNGEGASNMVSEHDTIPTQSEAQPFLHRGVQQWHNGPLLSWSGK